MKPIETHYNGYRFRSRLEARWAVFFDTVGIPYRYEPEGVELNDGRRWLPDFEIDHGGKWLIEVKGNPDQLDLDLLEEALRESDDVGGVILLGDPPVLLDRQRAAHGALSWQVIQEDHDGNVIDIVAGFITFGLDRVEVLSSTRPPRNSTEILRGSVIPDHLRPHPSLRAGYHKARAARFEFGETPKAARA